MEISVFTESNYMNSVEGVCDEIILTVECYLDGTEYDDPICGEIVSVFNKTANVEIELGDLHPNDLIKFEAAMESEIDSRANELVSDWMSAAAGAAYERGREEGW